MTLSRILLAAYVGAILLPGHAHADSVTDFYKGKTLRVLVATGPGTNYDFYARLFAENIGRFLPGSPTAVVENMPGAGQFRAAQLCMKRLLETAQCS